VPGLEISNEYDTLLEATNFSLRALTDPMSEDPFEYAEGASVLSAHALAGPIALVFEGSDVGCGVESVTVTLHVQPDGARGGAPARPVKLAYDVRLGSLYKRKGHLSWSGSLQLVMQRRAEPGV
jgi:hypothetical protein